jgi:hypothetical protein
MHRYNYKRLGYEEEINVCLYDYFSGATYKHFPLLFLGDPHVLVSASLSM